MTYLYILLTIILWGLWTFFGKIATKYNSPLAISSLSYFLYPIASLVLFFIVKQTGTVVNYSGKALFYTFLTGLAGILGTLFYYFALSKAPSAYVVSLTALYPAVTVLLAVFVLKEQFSYYQVIGLLLILAGSYMISYNH